MHPFSLICQVVACLDKAENVSISFRLYPILTDNLVTDYQGRFVDGQQVNEIKILLSKQGEEDKLKPEWFKIQKDHFGFYFELPVAEMD